MKKHILIISLLLISTAIFAQIPSIGIKGGVNFAKITSNDGGGSTSTGNLTTFNAGAFVDLKFGNISLQPALNYFGEGGTESLVSTSAYYPGQTAFAPNYAKVRLYYLQLPVDLVIHIPVIVGNIYFGAGPYVAEGISGKTTFTNDSYPSQKVSFGNDANDVKSTQFGLDAIVGFKIKGGMLINANYDLGLSNDLPSADNNGSSHSHVFSVSLGYAFL